MTFLDDIDEIATAYAADVAAGLYSDEAIGTLPAGALDWGSDLEGWQDVTPEARERSGSEPMVVIEAMLRRITTDKGELPDDDDSDVADYGVDVRRLLNHGSTPRQIEALGAVLESEIAKDDRVESIVATVSLVRGEVDALTIQLDGAIQAPDALRPFSLTLVATSAEVLIKALST
jgi:hypothetical protein